MRPTLTGVATTSAPDRVRGLAALSVVMVLFFIMALVAAYTNRNLVFEQRVAANSYRSEQALVAADGAVDWTLQMLNSGRVTMACQPSGNAADSPPRERYLSRVEDGGYSPLGVSTDPLFMSCVVRDAAVTCVCPTSDTPDPSPHAVKDWPVNAGGSGFRVQLQSPGAGARAGVVIASVRGCGTPGTGDTSCAAATDRPEADGIVLVRQTLGLVRALPVPPVAALTTGGAVTAPGAALRASNPDSATGMSVHSGGAIDVGGGSQFSGPAGSSDDGRLANDATLSALVPVSANRFLPSDAFFRGMFGMEPATFSRQPGLVRIDCSAAACTADDLRSALDRYPGLPIWFQGDLNLAGTAGGAPMGNSTHPAMVIATGRLTVAAAVDLQGFFYAHDVAWTGAASGARVQGAMVALTDFVADATATLQYDAVALRNIQLFYGSFVRAPGGWNRPDRPS